jgi:hypothetical protein
LLLTLISTINAKEYNIAAEELMRLNRVVASPALFFALLLGGQPPLQHAFAQVQGNSGQVLTWQEVAVLTPRIVRNFLSEKYGIDLALL